MAAVAEVIAEILVLGLAIAASPLPIVPVVLVLGGTHPRTSGPAFVLGGKASLRRDRRADVSRRVRPSSGDGGR